MSALVAALSFSASTVPSRADASVDPTVPVPQGSSVEPLASGTPSGRTATSTPMDVSVILRARHLAELKSRVAGGWAGHYLTTAQFAATYGQTTSVIHGIEDFLHGFGITTKTYADRLDISAHGTVGQFDKAMRVSLTNYRVQAPSANGRGKTHAETVRGTLKDPRVPRKYGDAILAVLGLSNYTPYLSHARRAPRPLSTSRTATAKGIPDGQLTPADFVRRYHLDALQKRGALGQGRTIGIVTLAAFDPTQALTFWNKYLGLHESASRLTRIMVDGGAGEVSGDNGSDETDLDVEQAGAIAPKAHLRVYEGPNGDLGFLDGYFAAASENIADTVSSSWGESETYVRQGIADSAAPAALLDVYDEVFAELGAQGQSSFTSVGDSGAYDAFYDTGTTDLSVDVPGSSPFITGAGGTTLPSTQSLVVDDPDGNPTGGTVSAVIPAERAWSYDYLFPMWRNFGFPDAKSWADYYFGGAGGGFSKAHAQPGYQRGIGAFNARPYFTPTHFETIAPGLTEPTDHNLSPAPALRSGTSNGRGLPDVSADADPDTGYAVYDEDLLGGFLQYGGTSFVAPQLNAATAVIDSALGRRVGFWNPEIYRLAKRSSSPFTPLNDTTAYRGIKYLFQTSATGKKLSLPGEFSNNNLYYTGRPGAFWNPATGLGTPDLTALANQFGR